MLIVIDVDEIFLLSNYRYTEIYFKVINVSDHYSK